MMYIVAVIVVLITLFGFVVFRGAPYVPTLSRQLQLAFDELYVVGEGDTLVDIGSGDGRVLREASRRGARAIGYELNPLLYALSIVLSRGDENVSVVLGDYWCQTLTLEATIVYTFATGNHIEKVLQWANNQAKRQDRVIYVMSFAFESREFTVYRRNQSHVLYRVGALHPADI